MSKKRPSYFAYLWKSTKWIVLNGIFATLPILLMCAIYMISEQKLGNEEIENLIYEGTVLFVCIAMVGAVLVDYILSGFRPMGFARAIIYLFPLIVLFLVTANYLLIHYKVVDVSRFMLNSRTSLIVISTSIAYMLFVKTDLYIKEDLNNDPGL